MTAITADHAPDRSDTRAKAVYYPAFDYLRITLATAVAVGHSGLPVWDYTGSLAVQIFFALSGWLIGGILVRTSPSDLPRFYFNRSTRIWIPYFVAVGLLIAASLLKDRVTSKWFEFVFYDLTFVYNFFGPPQLASAAHLMPLDGTGNHFWSICAEEQFYLVAPFLLTLVPTFLSRSIIAWVLIAGAVYASPFGYFFGAISLGVLAAVARDRFGDWHLQPVATTILIAIGLIGIAGLIYAPAQRSVSAGVLAIATVLVLARPGTGRPVGTFLGGISYPMYLNHWIGAFIAHAVFKQIGGLAFVSGLFAVIAGLVVASLLYLAVDKPVIRHRNRLYSPTIGKAVAATGFVLVLIGLAVGAHFSM